ncbi:MAG: ParB N-terminal domain-containing protein, partial [Gemmatimonadetes bacterium]|nr:ParB N-terminal domain-containing protein [Gemmatimonadota bacterium]
MMWAATRVELRMSPVRRKKKVAAEAGSRGLDARRLAAATPPASVTALAERVVSDGGSVLATYRDPLGSNWQLLAALPLDRVAPTPYQRNLSETHVERLVKAIEKVGRFLDPIVAVPVADGMYWSPNGNHRLSALGQLGARAIVAIVVPDQEVAHRILALNTEKAHNLRERAMEVARLAEGLAALDDRPEKVFELEFEEPSLLTLGFCYLENGRFSGGVYHPVLKKCERFSGSALPKAVAMRREHARELLELNEAVNAAVAALKAKGLESPYLKAFVVARINPLRFSKGRTAHDFDETIGKMLASAKRFDASKVRADQVARS